MVHVDILALVAFPREILREKVSKPALEVRVSPYFIPVKGSVTRIQQVARMTKLLVPE